MVRENYVRRNNAKNEDKHKRGRNTIKVLSELRSHKQEQDKYKIEYKEVYEDRGYVFADTLGHTFYRIL